MITVINKVVDIVTGELLGYRVTAGTPYTAVVSLDKAKELNVQDLDILQYMDIPIMEVVSTPSNKYGVIELSDGFYDELKESPMERLMGKEIYYGYSFKSCFLCPLDSAEAIDRMIKSAEGKYQDS